MVKRGKKPLKKSGSKVKKQVKAIRKPKLKKKILGKKSNPVLSNFFTKNQESKKPEVSKKLDVSKQKNQDIKTTQPKKVEKHNKGKGFVAFLLVLTIILGGLASYMFRNIYVYSVSGIVFLYLLLIIVLKFKKSNSPESKKPEAKAIQKIEDNVHVTYKTDFDNFYEFIKQNKKITVTQVALHFKMPKKKVEEWAQILEEHRLIKINYPLLGDQELIYED